MVHTRWGRQALEHLIEIYLSPNGDQLWEVASAPPSNDVTEPLEVGRKLLLELKAMSAGDHDVGETMLRGNKLSMRLRCAPLGTIVDFSSRLFIKHS